VGKRGLGGMFDIRILNIGLDQFFSSYFGIFFLKFLFLVKIWIYYHGFKGLGLARFGKNY
jgi:hypothetical protein